MTLQALLNTLGTLGVPVYQLAAVHTEPEFIVATVYGGTGIFGDDGTVHLLDKVQLDVLYQDPAHGLLHSVYAALADAGFAYDVQDVAYDPDYARIRAILHLEVI